MKRLFQLLVFLFGTYNVNSQCPVPSIIFPNGGEKLIGESKIDIVFEYGFDGYVQQELMDFAYFYYSVDGGENWIFEDLIYIDKENFPADQILKYSWQIPNVVSNDCMIKVKKWEWGCWDESETKFSIIKPTLDPGCDNSDILTVYPNPIAQGENLNVKITSEPIDKFHIQVLSSQGELIRQFQTEYSMFTVPTENIIAGSYIIRFLKEDCNVSRVFMIH